jgi:hypothetical protein
MAALSNYFEPKRTAPMSIHQVRFAAAVTDGGIRT